MTGRRDHDELAMLLPWYVNDTLEADERAVVEEHLGQCGECRDGVALLGRMQSAVTSESPSPIVPRPDEDGLLRRLDADQPGKRIALGRLAPRALAAALAIVALGVLLLLYDRDPVQPEPQRFETATASEGLAASGYVLAVRFRPETTAERQRELIAAMGGTSIGPGEQPHTQRVAVSPPAESLDELAGFTRDVEASPEVVSVRVVAVQLPVAQ